MCSGRMSQLILPSYCGVSPYPCLLSESGLFRSFFTYQCCPLEYAEKNSQRFDNFDEGAAQVRRLLDRDRKEIDFGELEKTFESDAPTTEASTEGSDKTARGVLEATPSNSGAIFAADKSRLSPFGPSPGSLGAVPFESVSKKPSIEPEKLSPDMDPAPMEESKPWWTKITLTQVVIVLSFTTIISLMIATFFFVLKVGAIRLNE